MTVIKANLPLPTLASIPPNKNTYQVVDNKNTKPTKTWAINFGSNMIVKADLDDIRNTLKGKDKFTISYNNKTKGAFKFELLPAIESMTKYSNSSFLKGAAEVPEIKIGIPIKTNIKLKSHIIPASSNCIQSLSIENKFIVLVGAFVIDDFNYKKPNIPNNAKGKQRFEALQASNPSTYSLANNFETNIVIPGNQSTLSIQTTSGDNISGNGVVVDFKIYCVRYSKTYYSITFLFSTFPVRSKLPKFTFNKDYTTPPLKQINTNIISNSGVLNAQASVPGDDSSASNDSNASIPGRDAFGNSPAAASTVTLSRDQYQTFYSQSLSYYSSRDSNPNQTSRTNLQKALHVNKEGLQILLNTSTPWPYQDLDRQRIELEQKFQSNINIINSKLGNSGAGAGTGAGTGTGAGATQTNQTKIQKARNFIGVGDAQFLQTSYLRAIQFYTEAIYTLQDTTTWTPSSKELERRDLQALGGIKTAESYIKLNNKQRALEFLTYSEQISRVTGNNANLAKIRTLKNQINAIQNTRPAQSQPTQPNAPSELAAAIGKATSEFTKAYTFFRSDLEKSKNILDSAIINADKYYKRIPPNERSKTQSIQLVRLLIAFYILRGMYFYKKLKEKYAEVKNIIDYGFAYFKLRDYSNFGKNDIDKVIAYYNQTPRGNDLFYYSSSLFNSTQRSLNDLQDVNVLKNDLELKNFPSP